MFSRSLIPTPSREPRPPPPPPTPEAPPDVQTVLEMPERVEIAEPPPEEEEEQPTPIEADPVSEPFVVSPPPPSPSPTHAAEDVPQTSVSAAIETPAELPHAREPVLALVESSTNILPPPPSLTVDTLPMPAMRPVPSLGSLQRLPSTSTSTKPPSSSSSGPGTTLLSQRVPDQLHALQHRTAQAVSSLAAEKAARASEMRRAQNRIEQLEKALSGTRTECEGWEAEALRLSEEKEEREEREREEWVAREVVESLERELEEEKKRKRRWREREARARLELGARRWKEKWELGVMDVEDRRRDRGMVELEYEVALARLKIGLDHMEKEEFQDTITRQQKRLLLLSGSRSVLLELSHKSESTISSLKVDLSASRKALAELKKEFNALQTQLAEETERGAELEREVEAAMKGEKKEEGREVAELRKSWEREKARREKVEVELRETKVCSLPLVPVCLPPADPGALFKASLKAAESESRDAQKNARAAELARPPVASKPKASKAARIASTKGKASAALDEVAVLASRKRKSLSTDGSDPVEVMGLDVDDDAIPEEDEEEQVDEDDDEDNEADASIELLKAEAAIRASNMTTTKSVKATLPVPFAGIRRREPTPVLRDHAPPSPLSVNSDAGGDEDDSYKPVKSKSRAGPAPARTNAFGGGGFGAGAKRKVAALLGDKSTNASEKGGEGGVKKTAKKISMASTMAETEVDEANIEDGEGPVKKKKRKLFGGAKKFEWGAVENADVNSLGIPSLLSPIKKPTSSGTTSIGILGRGLGGRPSIFS